MSLEIVHGISHVPDLTYTISICNNGADSGMKNLRLLLIGIIICGMALALWTLQQDSTSQAQSDPHSMRSLIEDLSARGRPMVFTFAEPVAPNVTIHETTGQDLRIGDDFLCISEPWNDGRRYRCIPYSNVVSVSFVD